jgi:hypothetical protein
VGTSLSLSKISDSLSSETSENVAACNSHKISRSFITLQLTAVVVTEGIYERKCGAHLVLWSLCYSRMILRMCVWEGPVCLSLQTRTSCFKQAITLTRYVRRNNPQTHEYDVACANVQVRDLPTTHGLAIRLYPWPDGKVLK